MRGNARVVSSSLLLCESDAIEGVEGSPRLYALRAISGSLHLAGRGGSAAAVALSPFAAQGERLATAASFLRLQWDRHHIALSCGRYGVLDPVVPTKLVGRYNTYLSRLLNRISCGLWVTLSGIGDTLAQAFRVSLVLLPHNSTTSFA